ncbi:unnamed protein product [Rhizoctonia solani]|uniref:Pectate lyase n=1 Tax=Rhizoctonia solani TaxID=456999 RepID=A0A8H2XRI2_9AGAM|nr:unnamed protein product [Rhizoctonia solani]
MVSFTLTTVIAAAAFFAQIAIAAPSPSVDSNGIYVKRAASCTLPSPAKTSSLSAPMTIKGTFDGGNVRYDRGKNACSGQKEGGDKDAVFLLESGATLKNVVIGANQAEGVHCKGPCNIYNTSGTTNIVGGGAKNANFGKLYRACGNCKSQYKRTVNISNVIAKNGKLLAGINSNYGDVATIKTSTNSYSSVKSICDTFEGNSNGNEPPKLTSNKSNANCKF